MIRYDYTEVNKKNLIKLRDYLSGLPDDYADLDMSWFAEDEEIAMKATPETGCGTSACVVGHGPAAGIPFGDEFVDGGVPDWIAYSRCNFIYSSISPQSLWQFAFSADWYGYLPEVIARLTLVIEENVPSKWHYGDNFA